MEPDNTPGHFGTPEFDTAQPSTFGGASAAADTISESVSSEERSRMQALRERAGNMKGSLADALETGADKLRSRAAGSGTLSTASDGTAAIGDTNHGGQLVERVAGGMGSTADWIRDMDVDGLKAGLERQAKEHPARTLLIAAGVGYLLGKAFRK